MQSYSSLSVWLVLAFKYQSARFSYAVKWSYGKSLARQLLPTKCTSKDGWWSYWPNLWHVRFVRWRLVALQLWVEIAIANNQNLGNNNSLAEGELQTCWSVNAGTILQLCKSPALWSPTQWIDVFHPSVDVPIEQRWTKHHSTNNSCPTHTALMEARVNGFKRKFNVCLWLWLIVLLESRKRLSERYFNFFTCWILKVAPGTLWWLDTAVF